VSIFIVIAEKRGFGAHFVSVLIYADDIVLVAPSATALRKISSICEDYAM